MFLCKKQSCKQFYGTENFVSTFTLSIQTQYLQIWFQILLHFPVLSCMTWIWSSVLSQKDTLEKTVSTVFTRFLRTLKSTHFRTVFWHWNRARSYSSSKDLEIQSFLESSQQSAWPQAKHAIKHYSRQGNYIYTEKAVWLHIGPRGNDRTRRTIPRQYHVQRLLYFYIIYINLQEENLWIKKHF